MDKVGRFAGLVVGTAKSLAAAINVSPCPAAVVARSTLLTPFPCTDAFEVDIPREWLDPNTGDSGGGQAVTRAMRSVFRSSVMQTEGVLLSLANGKLLNETELDRLSFSQGDVVARHSSGFESTVTARNDSAGEGRIVWFEFGRNPAADGDDAATVANGSNVSDVAGVRLQQELWVQVEPSPDAPETLTRLRLGAALTKPPEEWSTAMRRAHGVHRAYTRVLLGAMVVRLEDDTKV
jgi:hypothetical protein